MKILFTLLGVTLCFLEVKAQNWQPLQIPTDQDIWSSSFISDDEGWIGTENDSIAIIFHTVDKGETWNADTIQEAMGGISFIDFTSSLVGYAIVNGKAFKTSDGGSSWVQLLIPGDIYANPAFVTDSIGFISGNRIVFKTTDGGITWDSMIIYPGSYWPTPFNRLIFLDQNRGVGMEGEDYAWETYDGGNTWHVALDASLTMSYHSVDIRPSGSIVYTYDDDGFVVVSGGTYYGTDVLLLDIKCIDDCHLIAVGEGIIASTEDCSNWYEEEVPATLYSVNGFNTLYAFGEDGNGFKRNGFPTVAPPLQLNKSSLIISPNPFYESANILLCISSNKHLKIELLDLNGRKIKTITEGNFKAGNHQLQFERENLSPGIYLLQLQSSSCTQTQKLIVQ